MVMQGLAGLYVYVWSDLHTSLVESSCYGLESQACVLSELWESGPGVDIACSGHGAKTKLG